MSGLYGNIANILLDELCFLLVASHSSGLYSLGTLLLENSIQKINVCSEEHVSKKLKTDRNLNDSWTQLAELV